MKRMLLLIMALLLITACAKETRRLIVPKVKQAIDYGFLPPPSLVSDARLWPADHTIFTFTVEDMKPGLTDDYGGDLNGATITILSVTSDEAEDAPGTKDGNTLNDIVIAADCQSVQVRRERMGGGNGRVYSIMVSIVGNAGTQVADYIVTVPKWAWGWMSEAVDDGQSYTVSSNCPGVDCGAQGSQGYATIENNGIIWLAENLNIDVPGSSWCYDNNPANCTTYGRLYTKSGAEAACALLGSCWRLPTFEEWMALAATYGDGALDGSFNLQVYTALIDGGSSGFNAKLGGAYQATFSSFSTLVFGYYRASGSKNILFVKAGDPQYNRVEGYNTEAPDWGMSCRCVKEVN